MIYQIENLEPAEVAVLWLASDIERSNSDKPTILASNATLILMTVLAEGYSRIRDKSIAERTLAEIASYSKDLANHIAERGSYVRYDLPVRKLLEKIAGAGFPILSEEYMGWRDEKRTEVSVCYEVAAEIYEKTLRSLEEKGLIVDPPWYKSSLAVGSLIVLLGSVPLEINIKTQLGQQVVTSAEAKFWSYEKSTDGEVENIHINIKIAKFLDRAVENLGSGFAEAWKELNPERTRVLENESASISHNK